MVAVIAQTLFGSEQRRNGGHVHFAGSVPCVIGALHPDPDQRFVAEQLCEAHGHLSADRFPLGQDVVKMLARNAKHARDFCFGLAGRGDHILTEQFARMRRATVGVAAHYRLLVILLEVQDIGVAIPEFEGDAPRTIHMDRVAGRVVALQAVKVETGKIHVFRRGCGVKNIQPPQNARVHPCVNLGLACFPEGFQLFVGEALDHVDV